jgi:nucleoid-associated protein YgaU
MPVTAGFKQGTGYAVGGPIPAVLVGPPATSKIPNPGPGRVAFVTPIATIRCKLGATAATPGGGVAIWTEVARPGRTAGVEFTGISNRTLSIPVLLDGLSDRSSVESQVEAFEAISRPPAGSKRGTLPPVVRIGGMVPHGDREWVVTAFDVTDAVWNGTYRIRAWATVVLSQYLPLDLVKVVKKSTATSSTRTYTVKRGDTLGSIARDQMGAKSASAIAKGVATLKKLNSIRDPKAIKAGQKLKIPR